ncbi:Crp/Fnr family transcriptional regulator [Flavitalea flava]
MKNVERVVIKKGIKLLVAGNISNYLFFIESGLTMNYSVIDKKIAVRWFNKEGDFTRAGRSFFLQEKANQSIEALEDCVVWRISHEKLYYAFKEFIEFNIHRAVLAEYYFAEAEKLQENTLQLTPEEKIIALIAKWPEAFDRIGNAAWIASYLGLKLNTYNRHLPPEYKNKNKGKGKNEE